MLESMINFFVKLVGHIRSFLSMLEEAFLCFLLTSMIFLACFQIFFRFVLGGGFSWIDPLLRFLVPWVGMFGAAVATKYGRHIAIDLVSYLVPPKAMPWLHLAVNVISALVTITLTYAGYIFVQNEIIFGEVSGVLGIPVWGWNIVFPIAFGLIALRFIYAAFTDFLNVTGISSKQLTSPVRTTL